MAEVDWTAESALHLIEQYKTYPELWDSSHESYRVQTTKYVAWTRLSDTFQCDVVDLRKKLNSIFASYRREKSKIRNGGRSSWFLYQHMSFLPNHLENNSSPQKNDDSDQSSDKNDDNASSDEERTTVKQEPMTEHYIVTQHTKRPLTRKLLSRPLLKRKLVREPNPKISNNTLDSRLLETIKLFRKAEQSKKKDECDSFGEYIAVSLRKHDDRTQSMIKQAINNILFEQEMKKYSSGQYTVVLSNAEENPLILGDTDDK